jgi:hypothetical protein
MYRIEDMQQTKTVKTIKVEKGKPVEEIAIEVE